MSIIGSNRESAMWRPRFRLALLMLFVAVIAIGLGAMRWHWDGIQAEREAQRRGMRILLEAEAARARGRAEWARGMQKKGFVNAEQVERDDAVLAEANRRLKALDDR